jgi:hypothetical protein
LRLHHKHLYLYISSLFSPLIKIAAVYEPYGGKLI